MRNQHDMISKDELKETLEALLNEQPMHDSQAKHSQSYLYSNVEDKVTSEQDLSDQINGTEIEDVYIHVPFCAHECVFCSYDKIEGPNRSQVESYLEQVVKEIKDAKNKYKFNNLRTVHIGGGTPNFLNEKQLELLLKTIKEELPINNPSFEQYDIELKPVNLSDEKIELMKRYGVDRVSGGVQTFDDEVNRLNNRLGQTEEKTVEAIKRLKQNFDNVSVDLLASYEGHSLELLMRDCQKLLDLDVDSVFLYQVRQELEKGNVEDINTLNAFLNYFSENGYEILSQNQVVKKRNSIGYCEQREHRSQLSNLLGIGPSSVSEVSGFTFKNKNAVEYIQDSDSKLDESSIKKKTERNSKALYVIRNLRYFKSPDFDGFLVKEYSDKFGSSVFDNFGHEMEFMEQQGLVKTSKEKVELTNKGRLFTQWMDNYLTRHYK